MDPYGPYILALVRQLRPTTSHYTDPLMDHAGRCRDKIKTTAAWRKPLRKRFPPWIWYKADKQTRYSPFSLGIDPLI